MPKSKKKDIQVAIAPIKVDESETNENEVPNPFALQNEKLPVSDLPLPKKETFDLELPTALKAEIKNEEQKVEIESSTQEAKPIDEHGFEGEPDATSKNARDEEINRQIMEATGYTKQVEDVAKQIVDSNVDLQNPNFDPTEEFKAMMAAPKTATAVVEPETGANNGLGKLVASLKDLSLFINGVAFIKKVNLELRTGEIISLVCEQKSGINNLIDLMSLKMFEAAEIVAKQFRLVGFEFRTLREKAIKKTGVRDKIVYVQNNPVFALKPDVKIWEQFSAKYKKMKVICPDYFAMIVKLFYEFEIPNPVIVANQTIFDLEPETAIRVAMLFLTINDPKLVILDNITSDVDVNMHVFLFSVVNQIKVKKNLSILNITTDLSFAIQVSDAVGIYLNGRIIEYGKKHELLLNAKHMYTRAMKRALPEVNNSSKISRVLSKDDLSFMLKAETDVMRAIAKLQYNAIKTFREKLLSGEIDGGIKLDAYKEVYLTPTHYYIVVSKIPTDEELAGTAEPLHYRND